MGLGNILAKYKGLSDIHNTLHIEEKAPMLVGPYEAWLKTERYDWGAFDFTKFTPKDITEFCLVMPRYSKHKEYRMSSTFLYHWIDTAYY